MNKTTSLIRSILNEATEEMTLPTDSIDRTPETTGEKLSSSDFLPKPEPSTMGMPNQIPSMPQASQMSNTINKEILNKQLVLAITSELKSTVSTYEKRFDSSDLSIDEAKIYLNNFLESLAFYADKIKSLVGEEEAIEPTNEEPIPEESKETLPPTPSEEPKPEEEYKEVKPGESELTEPVEPENSLYTSPTEAIR